MSVNVTAHNDYDLYSNLDSFFGVAWVEACATLCRTGGAWVWGPSMRHPSIWAPYFITSKQNFRLYASFWLIPPKFFHFSMLLIYHIPTSLSLTKSIWVVYQKKKVYLSTFSKRKKKKSLFEYLFLTKMFKVINYWIIKIIIIKIKSIQVFVFFF